MHPDPRRVARCLLATSLVAATSLWGGPPAIEAQEPPSIEERVTELEKAAAAAADKPTVKAGADGFRLESADGDFSLKLRGYVHADGRAFEGESTGTDTFVLRRVRPILEATLYKKFDFRIMPDYGGGQTVLQDAYADLRFAPAWKLRVGKYKAPVGLERLQSATALGFVERAVPTLLVPNRDVGVQLHGDIAGGRATYAVMLSNGVPDGGSTDFDSDDDKDVSARVFLTPFAKSDGFLKDLGFGLSGSTGEAEGSPTSPGLPNWRTSGQQGFFAYRTSSVPEEVAFADGERTRFSPQGYFYRGPFGLLAELVTSSNEVRRGADLAELEHEAWQVAAYWVFGGKASYRGVVPDQVFDPAQGTWGAFELVARVAELDMDEDTFPSFANPATSASGVEQWTIGVNWYLNRNLKLNLNYDNFEFEGGAADGDRTPERVILARMQVSF